MKISQELIPTDRLPSDQVNSRFRDSKIYVDENGNVFYETYEVRVIPYSEGDIYHEVTAGEEGRLDLLAFDYYGNPALWWIIAEANDIVVPIKDVYAGLVLRVPDPSSVFSLSR